MAKSNLWTLLLVIFMAFGACTKDGNTIYQTNPDEEKPSTAPLVTVIYGPNSLGDRSYCDKIYRGVEASASKHGIRTLHLVPENMEQGQTYLEMMFQQMESAQDSVSRLFIATSPVYDEFIRKNNRRLENNPNADLLYLETSTPLEGKGSTFYIDYYGAMYMAGCLSRYSISFDLLLLVLANPYTQSVVEAGEGFVDGYNDTTDSRWDWGPNEYQPLGSLKDFEYTDRLHQIAQPTLICSGTRDICTPVVAASLYDNIPNSQWHLFRRSRHTCFIDAHEEYCQVLTRWLQELD